MINSFPLTRFASLKLSNLSVGFDNIDYEQHAHEREFQLEPTSEIRISDLYTAVLGEKVPGADVCSTGRRWAVCRSALQMCVAPLLYSLRSCPGGQADLYRTVVPHWGFGAVQVEKSGQK